MHPQRKIDLKNHFQRNGKLVVTFVPDDSGEPEQRTYYSYDEAVVEIEREESVGSFYF